MISRKTLKFIVLAVTITALVLTSVAIVLASADFGGTVDPTDLVSPTGVVVLTGVVTCNTPLTNFYISGTVRQSAGRKNVIQVSFNYNLPYPQTCLGQMPWSIVAAPTGEGFTKGTADVIFTLSGCDQYYNNCRSTPQTFQTITLIPARKWPVPSPLPPTPVPSPLPPTPTPNPYPYP
jgi:hypothetical protein